MKLYVIISLNMTFSKCQNIKGGDKMSKLIKCKSCGAEISDSAKNCPQCGAKNKKPIYKKWWFWVVVAVIFISVVSNSGKNNEVSKKGEVTTNQEQTYNIGDVVATDKFEITVTGIKTANSVGVQYLSTSPAEGGIYVCVDFEYKNISDSSISSFSCPNIKLKDEKNTYDSDINASSYYATQSDPNRKILSDLNPGIKVKDSKVFEISKEMYDKGGFSLLVDADKDFVVKLN